MISRGGIIVLSRCWMEERTPILPRLGIFWRCCGKLLVIAGLIWVFRGLVWIFQGLAWIFRGLVWIFRGLVWIFRGLVWVFAGEIWVAAAGKSKIGGRNARNFQNQLQTSPSLSKGARRASLRKATDERSQKPAKNTKKQRITLFFHHILTYNKPSVQQPSRISITTIPITTIID